MYNGALKDLIEANPMNKPTLPAHIRQLVDKHNFVIAIKTHAEEQGISLEEAKAQIDAYEESQKKSSQQSFNNLTQGLDNHLQQENIQLPLIPYWVKRVAIIVLVMLVLGVVFYQLVR